MWPPQLRGTSVDALPVSETQVAHAVRTGMLQVLARGPYAPSRSFGRGNGHVLPLVRPAVTPETLLASANGVTSADGSPTQTSPRRRRRPGAS